jgi:hypothetical protein
MALPIVSELGARLAPLALTAPLAVFAFQQALALLATLARAGWLAASTQLAGEAAQPTLHRDPSAQAAEI